MYGLIINEKAGNGKGERIWKNIAIAFRNKNIPFLLRFTERPHHGSELVRHMLEKGVTKVIVVGGDGTIHEVAKELVYKNISLGIIPTGSGNDFARSLGVPMNDVKALERIFADDVKQVDLLHLGDHYCLTVTGIGLDGSIAKHANESIYKRYFNQFRLGGLAYIASIISTLQSYEPTKVKVMMDGVVHNFSEVWLVAVANAPNYAGGIQICPEALQNDGLLNVCIVHGLKKWEVLRLLPKAYKGKHQLDNHVTFLKGEDVFIQSDPPVLVQSDGEFIMESPTHITVEKDALRVV
ncbi:diacylglycerol/lipid kinase family protein [Salipaludibacillus daqingensis]|uniref:diacylglycerol/lipid kinase family protein n=1 Tax=Salipaludibacillus daqingensis TaxID=3041001 RepID=UPI0024747227|nr:diacylglycerol kinase family lipid kinase [Salipaludibacillus daqingensis]